MKTSTVTALALLFSACATKTPVVNTRPMGEAIHEMARAQAMDDLKKNFARVGFESDSALLTQDAQDALADNVLIMAAFPEITIEVEGHCDERGSDEYNLALGERRATGIYKYMVTAGLDPKSISTISYGEEVPLSIARDEEAFALNRRAEFRMTLDHAGIRGSVTDVTRRDSTLAVR